MRAQIAKGAAWMVLFKWIDRSIGLISTLILARLLVPADFGVVAMAMSVIAVIELATAFSFDAALIQKAQPAREHYDTAWTLNVMLAVAGAVVTIALAPLTALFYGEPRLTVVMYVLGAGWLAWGFENVGVVDFRRNLDFHREFRFLGFKRVIAFAVTVMAALMFRSYWALVVGMVTGRVAGVLLSYLMHPYRPRLSVAASRELLSFSGWMLATNVLGTAISRVSHFFIGRMLGAQALGAYTIGAEFALLAHTELAAPINRALFPGYSRLADRPDEFRRICIDATAAILLVVLPASVGIAAVAEPMVRVLLGDKWSAAVPVIEVLAISGAISAIVSNNAAAYLALGRPRLVTGILLSRLLVLLPLLFLLANRGLSGVAIAEMLSSVASLAVSYPVLFKQLRLSVAQYLRALWRPLAASILMGFAVRAGIAWLGTDGSASGALLQLIAGVLLGVIVYSLLVYALWLASGRPTCAELMLAQRFGAICKDRLARVR